MSAELLLLFKRSGTELALKTLDFRIANFLRCFNLVNFSFNGVWFGYFF